MTKQAMILAVALSVGGCASGPLSGVMLPDGGPGSVIVADDEGRGERGNGGESERSTLRVPPGHYPPPGECRIWYEGRPPGQQPPPERCDRLVGRVPFGAFLLYNEQPWDTRVDWRRENARRAVPDIVLRIMSSLVRG